MSFATNLSTLRKKSGLSQDKLAEQLNISRQAISKWESGMSSPDIDTLLNICSILKVTPDQLLLGTDVKESSTSNFKKLDDVFVITSIFLMLVFIGGIALLIMNLTNSFYTPNITSIAFRLMTFSILLYVVLLSLKLYNRFKKRAKE